MFENFMFKKLKFCDVQLFYILINETTIDVI